MTTGSDCTSRDSSAIGPIASQTMKGVILAGGTGSRLHPLTRVTNKHLLPVGEKPMVQWAVDRRVLRGDRPRAPTVSEQPCRSDPAATVRGRARLADRDRAPGQSAQADPADESLLFT